MVRGLSTIALLAAGCRSVLGVEDPFVIDAALDCAIELFDADAIDPHLWSVLDSGPNMVGVRQEAGQLVLVIAPNTEDYNGVGTRRIDLGDGDVTVKVEEHVAGPAELHLLVEADSKNRYFIAANNGLINFESYVRGAYDFDNRVHTTPTRYWRIRHTGTKLELLTSSNGTMYTLEHERFSVDRPADVTVQLFAKGNSSTTSGVGRFDDFLIKTPRCP